MMRNGEILPPKVDTVKGGDYKWWALAVICVGTFTSTMDNSIVNLAIPTLGDKFNVGATVSVWVYLAYMLTVAGLTLTFGQTGDRWGRKRIYTYGLLISALGLGLCAIATSMPMLISFRVVQAVGAGMMIAVGPAMITRVFSDSERGLAMGLYAASVAVGLTSGPVLGGILLDTMGWQSIFYIRLPVVLLVAVLAWKFLVEQKSPQSHHSFDKWGSIAFFTSMFALLLGLNQSAKLGWTSPLVLICLSSAAILIPAFIIIERKVKQPLLDLSLFRSRGFALSNTALLLSFISRIFAVFLMPFFLMQGLDYSPSKAGLVQITIPIAMIAVAIVAGWLSDKIGSRLPTAIGFAILGLSLHLLSTMNADSSLADVIIATAVMGAGIGMFESPNNSLIMGSVPKHKLGTASAMLATSRGVGLTIGLAISSSIYAARKALYLESAPEASAIIGSFQDALIIVAYLCIAGVIASIFAGNARRKPSA